MKVMIYDDNNDEVIKLDLVDDEMTVSIPTRYKRWEIARMLRKAIVMAQIELDRLYDRL